MADLNTLAKRVRNTRTRRSNFFLRTYGSTPSEAQFVNMGRIQDASFEAEPIVSDADQDGRESVQAYNVTLTFTMQQASKDELGMIADLAMPPVDLYPNGHTIYVSGHNKVTTAMVNDALDEDDLPDMVDDDPDGIGFINVLLKPSPTIPLSDGVSLIVVETTGRVGVEDFANLESDPFITISAE